MTAETPSRDTSVALDWLRIAECEAVIWTGVPWTTTTRHYVAVYMRHACDAAGTPPTAEVHQ